MRFGPRLVVYEQLHTLLAAALPSEERLRFMAEGAAWTEVEAAEAAVSACDREDVSASCESAGGPDTAALMAQ